MCQNTCATQHNALQSTHCRNIRTRTRTLGSPPTAPCTVDGFQSIATAVPLWNLKTLSLMPNMQISATAWGSSPSWEMSPLDVAVHFIWEQTGTRLIDVREQEKPGFHFASTKGNQNRDIYLFLGSCLLYKWKLYSTEEGNSCTYQYTKSAFFHPHFLVSVIALILFCKYV